MKRECIYKVSVLPLWARVIKLSPGHYLLEAGEAEHVVFDADFGNANDAMSCVDSLADGWTGRTPAIAKATGGVQE